MAKKAGVKKGPAKGAPKQAKNANAKIPGSFSLSAQAVKLYIKNWQSLTGILAIFLILDLLLAGGVGNISSTLKSIKNSSTYAQTTTATSQAGSVFQTILFITASLALIWAIRHLAGGNQISTKEAYYKGMYPFIPFVLVILVLIIQLLPMTLGLAAVALILSSVLSSTAVLLVLFSLVFAVLAAWSLYMLSGSILALYIVTLPDMRPMQALKSAKQLVAGKRWIIIRKLLFIPLVAVIGLLILVAPVIWMYIPLAVVIFYLLGAVFLYFFHAYFYSLYRSLI